MYRTKSLISFYALGWIIISSLLFSLVTDRVADATSVFDDDVNVVNNLQVGGGYYTDSCEPIEMSGDWLERIKNNASYRENSTARTSLNEMYDQLENRVATGGGWFVSSQRGSPTAPAIVMIAVFNPDAPITFGYYNDVTLHALNFPSPYMWIQFKQRLGDCELIMDGQYAGISDKYIINNTSNSQQTIGMFQFASNNIIYPSGYSGSPLPTPSSSTDIDQDGLNFVLENSQQTSDARKDTDEDGLSDYVESQWYTDRQSIFCGTTCTYPNPMSNDLYVEFDWMKDGLRTMKPSEAQLTLVKDAFENQGITAHFDVGQYGGGNELPTYTQNLSFYRTNAATDFYDYKYGNSTIASNFDNDRYQIWHYVITGYRYTQNSSSSGASYVGDDDSFISLGQIEDDQGSNADNAIAGTILHELGHSLCLSSERDYVGQSASCIYGGIHAENDPTYQSYHSVMNYDYQFSNLVNLSSGVDSPEDHDDWGVVKLGMGDFTSSDAEGENPDEQNMFNRNAHQFTSKKVRRIVD